MSKEFLLVMIDRKLYLELAATGLLLLVAWFLVFTLAFKVVCRKVHLRAIWPGATAMLVYTFIASLYLTPVMEYALTPLVFMLLVPRVIPGYNLGQVIFIGLVAVISQALGRVFINPLCLLDPQIAAFLVHTFPGTMITLAAGMAGPGLLLLILPDVPPIFLQPFLCQKKDFTLDLKSLVLPGWIYLGLLTVVTISVESPATNPRLIQKNIIPIYAAILIMGAAYGYELHRIRKKAVISAMNHKTGRMVAMQVIRRTMLDENNRFRGIPPKLPEFADIFLGSPLNPDQVNLFIFDTLDLIRNFIMDTQDESILRGLCQKYEQLTPTELDVMTMLAEGHNNAKIAFCLDLDEARVEDMIIQLLKKFETDIELVLGAFIITVCGASNEPSRVGSG